MKKIVSILLLFFIFFLAKSQDTVFLNDQYLKISNIDSSCLAPIYHFVDSTGKLPFHEVTNKPFTKEILKNELTSNCKKNSNWYKIIVKNYSKKTRQYSLIPLVDNYNFKDFNISLYDTSLIRNIVARNGSEIPESDRDAFSNFKLAVTFYLDIGETKAFFINISPNEFSNTGDFWSDPSVTFEVLPTINTLNNKLLRRIYQGIVLGFLLLMFIYHLILFLKIRLSEYLAFSFYAFSASLFYFQKNGFGTEIFGNIWFLKFSVTLNICMFSYLFLALFYVDFKNAFRLSYRILYIGIWFYAIFVLPLFISLSLNLISSAYYDNVFMDIAGILVPAIGVFTFIFTFVPYIKLAINKNKSSYYFLGANFTFVMCLIGYIIGNIFQLNSFRDYILELGFATQMFVFAIGLADKMRSILIDKNKSQIELLNQLQINTQLQEKVNRELEDKVKKRTAEIEKQKEEIFSQSQELATQRDMLYQQKKDITDSMEYASFIQQALLTSQEVLDISNIQSFILYKPRDIISGDFYWFKQIKNYLYFTAADCTGHGVPGAFMSVLGISLLNDIVGKRDLNPPHIILNELRKRLKKSLKQDNIESISHDGMDIAFCLLDIETKKLQFSGAFNSLFLIRNSELIEYPADRMPVGVHPKDTNDFTSQEIQLEIGDSLYIFSDGYHSQFGGEEGKKFNMKRFKQLLIEISNQSMIAQKKLLNDNIIEWKQDIEQVDDILVIGLKI